MTFKRLSEICFHEYAAVVFALEIEIKGKNKSIIRLNPSNFSFVEWKKYSYYLYVIGEDESLA